MSPTSPPSLRDATEHFSVVACEFLTLTYGDRWSGQGGDLSYSLLDPWT